MRIFIRIIQIYLILKNTVDTQKFPNIHFNRKANIITSVYSVRKKDRNFKAYISVNNIFNLHYINHVINIQDPFIMVHISV